MLKEIGSVFSFLTIFPSSDSTLEENIYTISNVTIVIKIKGINTIIHDIIDNPRLHIMFKSNVNISITTLLKNAVLYIPLNMSIMIWVIENATYNRAGAQSFSIMLYNIT